LKATSRLLKTEVFQVKVKVQQHLDEYKRRIDERLDPTRVWLPQCERMFKDANVHYEVPHPDRLNGLDCAGLGALQALVAKVGLADAIDGRLHLFKRHQPYFESDHVLNIAYNLLTGGLTLSDIEKRRNHETYLDALGAQRIPDPTTAGDFLRRFDESSISTLMDVLNDIRVRLWRQQPADFLQHAIVDVDGTIEETTGQCKQGMDISYKGLWGYQPLLVSLANTREPLFIVNRPGNRPSHEGAAAYLDRAIALTRRAGFVQVSLRGDGDFSQTEHLDRWDDGHVRFVFGMDSSKALKKRVAALPAEVWRQLQRPSGYPIASRPRRKQPRVKQEKVVQHGFQTLRLVAEHVASFDYQPGACRRPYRIVVVRQQIDVECSGHKVGEQIRYRFLITNERDWPEALVVQFANGRCNQENLVAQLKSGVRAVHAPVNTLCANGAYMVIASLAWSLKAWLGLIQQDPQRQQTLLRIEFKKFLDELIRIPCELIQQGRQVVYRLLQYKPWAGWLFDSLDLLRRLRWT
jgi:hypothetical protein